MTPYRFIEYYTIMKFEKFYSEDEYLLSSRKTRKDVLTPWDAVEARKSSKNHKLKPRHPSRDQTKMSESKTKTRDRKQSRLLSVY